jgi:ribose/xylose/arabinose/galactoside ABC-type transport system permease subunit
MLHKEEMMYKNKDMFRQDKEIMFLQERPVHWIKDVYTKYGLILLLLAVMLLLWLVSPAFLTSENLINVLRQVSIVGILATGMTLVIITGGIDLSVGSLLAVSGVIAGSIIKSNPEIILLAFLSSIVACGMFGFANGVLITKFNIPPFIASLAIMTIGRGFALVYSDGRPYILTSKPFAMIGQGSIGPIPYPVLIYIFIALLVGVMLHLTKFGRYVYAVGGNENAAKLSGVNVGKTKLWVYTLNGLLAGLGGVILASRINSGNPSIGMGYEMDVIAAVVIGGSSLTGGVGSITGTLIGTFMLGVINNGLNLLNVSAYYQQIAKGIIILGAVMWDIRTKTRSR